MDAASNLLYQALMNEADRFSTARVAVVNACVDPCLTPLAAAWRLDVLQDFRPDAVALETVGMPPAAGLDGQYGAIAIRPSKNKAQTLGWVADALAHLAEGGVLLLAAANIHGAKSYEKLLSEAGPLTATSKAKCRLLRLVRKAANPIPHNWEADAEPDIQEAHGLWSAPGLFSWEKPDLGSALLLEQLPEKLGGTGMDLCCGYGLLAARLLQQHADIKTLHLVDADRLAITMARLNTESFADKVELHWRDAAREALHKGLDWIVCNPPFHTGQDRDVELGQTIVARACQALRPGGRIWLVANRKLPYEKVLANSLREVTTLSEAQGYKILEGIR